MTLVLTLLSSQPTVEIGSTILLPTMIDTYSRDSVNINTSLSLLVTHCRNGIDQAVSDLVLSHVFDDVKLSRSGFGDRHVCYPLQLVITEQQD